MKYKKLISVAMITYNQEEYVGQALNSILMQRGKFDLEIIVGDDASTDTTPDIIRKYQQQYPNIIKPILRDKNVGVTNNFCDVLKHCTGEYIAQLEGDDYWTDKYKLEKQRRFLDKNVDYVCVAHDYKMIDADGQLYSHRTVAGEYTKKHFMLGKLPGHTATLLFRNFFKDGKDDYNIIKEASASIGDRTIIVLLLLHGKIYSLKEVMSVYRVFSSKEAWSSKLGKKSWELNPYYDELKYYINLTNYAKQKWKTHISAFCNKSYCVYSAAKRYSLTKEYRDKVIKQQTWSMYDEGRILLFLCCIYLFLRDAKNGEYKLNG
ncbi:MAG: glycosyltransferase [Clostridia bacterium]|nr:glycosyltransferase [Clostridia bacterium]NCD02757.1 glycosyltransferase [Clostridia bacterium]